MALIHYPSGDMIMIKEGSLEAPTRHPIDWQNDDYYDIDHIDRELRRVFDVCHGCRRCFNLCDSFPRLFDLIDASDTGELDAVDSQGFKPVADACTLCDMCFLTKCPYVPPHEFNLDFPHLMVRYRAAERKAGKKRRMEEQLAKTDRNAVIASKVSPIANWATSRSNRITRPVLEKTTGVHREADLPKYVGKSLTARADVVKKPEVTAPAYGRKAVFYTTCFGNYNDPKIGEAALKVLAHNGVDVEMMYPGCCGMPKMERGDIAAVAAQAEKIASALRSKIEDGYSVIAPVPSCALMLKFEWPLILPDNEDVIALAKATYDIDQYLVDIANNEGLADGLKPLDETIALHIPCHSRAQNIGQKSAEILRLIPDVKITVIERCSGHGGTWGIMRENFDVALKVGRPVATAALKAESATLASACPLAAPHILQGMEKRAGKDLDVTLQHPIEIIARAYGF